MTTRLYSVLILVCSLFLFVLPQSWAKGKTIVFETSEVTQPEITVSPDARDLAFTILGRIFLAPVNGGTAEQLTEGSFCDSVPSFAHYRNENKMNGTNPSRIARSTVRACVLALNVSLSSTLHAGEPRYEWVKVTAKAAFAPRDGAGALSFRDRMWLLGGWNPQRQHREFFPRICNNEVWSSTDGGQWTLVKPNTFKDQALFDPTADWEGRHTAGYAVFRDRMWIIGGDVNQGHYQNDVWTSQNGREWKLVNPAVPWAPRALHYTVVHDNRIWVMGGQTMPGFAKSQERFYRDIWATRDGVDWVRVEPKEPYWSARGMIGASAVFKGRTWILGGGTYDTPATPTRKFHNDVWSSADGVHWKQNVQAAPWAPRQYHEVAVWDDRLWVLEGYFNQGGNRNDVWHSSDGAAWQELTDTPWKPRHAASVFVYDDALWMVAGNNMESDVWKLRRR